MGIDYHNLFADLWSETDFTYDQINRLYLSRRMPRNLESMGVGMDFINCHSCQERQKALLALPNGQWLIIGMDAFFIPWVPFYQTFHHLHYFIAKKESHELFYCFDPTYDKPDLTLTHEHIVSYTTDACVFHKSSVVPFSTDISTDAKRILENHPQTQKEIIAQILACAHGNHKNTELLAKYMTALINNRYLYLHYLEKMLPKQADNCIPYFSKEYFRKWHAAKHGLYKASIIGKNIHALIQEVCAHIKDLMQQEIQIAKNIISIKPPVLS